MALRSSGTDAQFLRNMQLATLYWFFSIAMASCGIVQILVNKCEREKLKSNINIIGIILNTSAVFVFILSSQPYPAILFLTILLIRGIVMLIKKR